MLTRRSMLGAVGALAAAPLALRPRRAAADTAGPADALLAPVIAAGVPGALAVIRSGGTVRTLAAGVARLGSDRPPAAGDAYRIASITKTFVATVALQLVHERRFDLDDPIARYLPGLLPAADAGTTIRHLLQHTSGLADYHDYDGLDSAAAFEAHRYDDPTPRASIALAAAHSPLFPPGTAWQYADTNYLVIGLLVERVSGRPVAAAVTERIIGPLGLARTSFPVHDPFIAGSHLHGYLPSDAPGEPYGDTADLIDFTDETVNQTGAAGAIVSTGPDLLRFHRALLGGRLLPASLLDEMTTTVSTGAVGAQTGMVGYGLGLAAFTGPGTDPLWGNTGSICGYTSVLAGTRDGDAQFATTFTMNPVPDAAVAAIIQAAEGLGAALD